MLKVFLLLLFTFFIFPINVLASSSTWTMATFKNYKNLINSGLSTVGFSTKESNFWKIYSNDNLPAIDDEKKVFFRPFGLTYNLQSYFPNDALISSYYLYQNQPAKVLWFEKQSQSTFLMYNYAPWDPKSRCHYDKFSWDNGFLNYFETRDQCTDINKDTIYDPPIIFLPQQWNTAKSWKRSGSSTVKINKNNSTVCTGNNNYEASIVGLEQVSNTDTVHFRTKQVIKWDNLGECAGWQDTRWQEDYWLTDSMTVESGVSAKGILKTTGGNLDNSSDTWNITFDLWKKFSTD